MNIYWEWYFIAIIALWTLLFPAGGTELPATKKGYKWLRRFVAPFLTIIFLFLIGGIAWWRIVCAGIGLSVTMHLGYGEKYTWLGRAVTAVLMPLPCLFLGWSWLISAFPGVFLGLYALSNWQKIAKQFPWVVVCAIYGAHIGATVCSAAFNGWH